MPRFLTFTNVTFFYPSSIQAVLENFTVQFPPGWTGITGDNGAGKTTLLFLAAGLERPSSGKVEGAGGIYCPQRTDNPPEAWEDFFYSGDREAERLMSRLAIGADYPERWDSLSHGERKRTQLAAALWRNPPLLAVDEPTNHLDREGRAMIAAGLEGYSGTGLLVSHDRALLDRLCGQCLFIRRGEAVLRPGGVTKGLEEEEREKRELEHRLSGLKAERGRVAAETDRRRRDMERSKNKFSKKHIDPRDHSAKAKVNLAKLSGKDAGGAKLYQNMQRRLGRLEEDLANTRPAGERKQGLTLPSMKASMDRLYYSPPGSIPLGKDRLLSFPELLIRPGDRIALTGPNGAGKSTLIAHILAGLPPRFNVLFIPQEIPAGESERLLKEVTAEDEKARGEILARFSRLGSEPKSLLQSSLPSPGEIRKLLLARGVFTNPALIIMDEPTNHLDLNSTRLLEETLAEVEAALLLVSHDEVFLSKLARIEWAIGGDGVMTAAC